MENRICEWVGSECGHHASYIFYKGVKYLVSPPPQEGVPHQDPKKTEKWKILSIGQFFFVKIWGDSDLVSVAEIQLLWEDKTTGQKMSSVRLYFLPEFTAEGRLPHHGEDEMIAVAEKAVLRVVDLLDWMAPLANLVWERGAKGIAHKDCIGEDAQEPTNKKLDLSEVDKVREEIGDDDINEKGIVVVSAPHYYRYRSILKRLEGVADQWMKNNLVVALGGFTTKTRRTSVMFAKEVFDYPELEEHPQLCNHLAPKLKGRPRKRRKNEESSPEGSEPDSNSCDTPTANNKVNGKDLLQPRPSARKDLINILSQKNTKEEMDFLKKLIRFMEMKGTPIERPPMLGFKQIDLHLFFNKVEDVGGYNGCVTKKAWKSVYDDLGGNPQNTSAATCTRRHYEKYLLSYERHLRSDDTREDITLDETSGNLINGAEHAEDTEASHNSPGERKAEVKTESKPYLGLKPLQLLTEPSLLQRKELEGEEAKQLKIDDLIIIPTAMNHELIMSMVTGPKYSELAQPSRSGTCGSVSQLVPTPGSKEAMKRPLARICMQSLKNQRHTAAKHPSGPSRAQVAEFVHATGTLWEDTDFPAHSCSIFDSETRPSYLPSNIVWMRPHEMVPNPQLITNGVTRFDINQGRLGDCWFLAWFLLTLDPVLFNLILPPGQTIDRAQGYIGAVVFRFYVCGEWREVVVDDRLPTVNGRLLFLKSTDNQEFWPALLEKAFAKLNGSYHSLNGGTFEEANSYFGGITESFNIRGPFLEGLDPIYVKERLIEAGSRGSLAGAAIYNLGASNEDTQTKYGLPSGHEYSLTGFESGRVRVRNPWGEGTEWRQQESEADGEFWMDWPDFMAHFHQVQVAHYSADAAAGLPPGSSSDWTSKDAHGSWTQETSGGCPNFKSFYRNTQFQVNVDSKEGGNVRLIIALDQVSKRRAPMGQQLHAIGFIIYNSETGKRLDKNTLMTHPWVADSGIYRFQKQVVGRYSIPPGTYTIIPTTFFPGKEASFHLRIFHSQEPVSLAILPQ